MKVSEAITANRVFNNYADQRMSMRLSLWFVRNEKFTSEILEMFREKTKELFDSYAEESIDGEMRIPDKAMPDYQNEINILLNEEVDVDVYKIKESDFGDFELTPADVFAIIYAIEV